MGTVRLQCCPVPVPPCRHVLCRAYPAAPAVAHCFITRHSCLARINEFAGNKSTARGKKLWNRCVPSRCLLERTRGGAAVPRTRPRVGDGMRHERHLNDAIGGGDTQSLSAFQGNPLKILIRLVCVRCCPQKQTAAGSEHITTARLPQMTRYRLPPA